MRRPSWSSGGAEGLRRSTIDGLASTTGVGSLGRPGLGHAPLTIGAFLNKRSLWEVLTLYHSTGLIVPTDCEERGMAMTIGQVASAADVNIQTIRYYERRGLVLAQRRTPAGYRQYAADAVERLRFIRHAQELGFTLKEIQELLGLRVRHGAACGAVERKTRAKLVLVQQKIVALGRIERTLERLAAACAARRSTDACPILDALEEE